MNSEKIQRCWDLLTSSKVGPIKLATRNQTLLCAIADAQQWLTDSEVLDGINHIAAEIEAPMSETMAREAVLVLRQCDRGRDSISSVAAHAAQSDPLSKLTVGNITKMKVGEVKEYLAAVGLSTDGLKKVLVERLVAAREAALSASLRTNKKYGISDMGSTEPTCSTILILNHQLHEFPWEGIDVMGGCSGVTRMLSLDLILQNANRAAPGTALRRDRVRFLLNPAGDLKSTQTQLEPVLENGATTLGWKGIIGEVPDPDELRNYLLDADLFIYCGHGSGEAYLHRDKILSLQGDCSAALLFGCSSGRLEQEGIFGPSGAVLSYLRAGSPAVVAMLWDVTDKDTDQLSVRILQEWLLADFEERDGNCSRSLAQVLQDSRDVCKLKYLNGHAAVCYGLPLHVTAD
ncbi:Separin [Phytophthora boehmeriae]|uniref:separase n=1 Tax=Phytophthora boehmeriae TaxID=109152 RepID=A0A8T1WWZ9_9STRA|nr:Separin [Phytophthora boehmeriae]